MMTIGFLGFGEVGHSFAQGFRQAGVGVLAFDAAPASGGAGQLARKRASDADVSFRDDLADVVADANIVFCAVPSTAALDVARQARPRLRAHQGYYDLTAAHPQTKRDIQQIMPSGGDGPAFADLAIVGPVRVLGHAVPILASGELKEEHLTFLRSVGMDIDVVSDQPGDASAIKLSRSVFTKGIEALLVETLMLAQRLGVADTVLQSIGRTLASQPFPEAANRYVTGNAIHAERRVHEVEDALAMLVAADVDPVLTRATLERMKLAAASGAREHFAGVPPEHFSAVIDFYSSAEEARNTSDKAAT